VCAFQEVIEAFRIDQVGDVKEAIKAILQKSMERIQFASIAEVMTGRVADADLSAMLKQTGFIVDIANKVLSTQSAEGDVGNITGAIFFSREEPMQRPSVERIIDTDILSLEADDDMQNRRELLQEEIAEAL
jgi:hypothetical protein